MKDIRKRILFLMSAVMIMVMMFSAGAYADSYKLNGEAEFDGSEIKSDFYDGKFEDTVTNLQPGDDVSLTITYRNIYDKKTNWYMANEVIQTLEKTSAAKKVAEGTGTPENGAYTYELIHIDNSGNKNVLFSNSEVGGEASPDGMQGLEQATNALSDWFFLQSLEKGEKGTLILNVAFEGETEVNDYMDTRGALAVKFAVELAGQGNGNPGKGPGDNATTSGPETSDYTQLFAYMAILAAGILLLVIVMIKRRRRNHE